MTKQSPESPPLPGTSLRLLNFDGMSWGCPPWGFPKRIPQGWRVEVGTAHIDPLLVVYSFTRGAP